MAGLPDLTDSTLLTPEVLRIELGSFAQNELRRELKSCLLEFGVRLQEDLQASVKDAVEKTPSLKSRRHVSVTSHTSGVGANEWRQRWSTPRPPRFAKDALVAPEPPPLEPIVKPMLDPIASCDISPLEPEVDGPSDVSPGLREVAAGSAPQPPPASPGFMTSFAGDHRENQIADNPKASVSTAGPPLTATKSEETVATTLKRSPTVDKLFGIDKSAIEARVTKRRSKNNHRGLTFQTYAQDADGSRQEGQMMTVMKLYSANTSADPDEITRVDRFMVMCKVVEKFIDWPVAISIFLNGVFLGIQAHYQSDNLTQAVPTVFPIFECIFCFIFTSELSIRICSQGPGFFFKPGWRWNVFDTLLVGMQLVEVIGIIATEHESSSATSVTNVSFLRLLRILRLFRVLRLVRLLQFIGDLNTIISSIANSMRSLFWTMVLLLLMVYMAGIVLTQLAFSYRVEHQDDSSQEAEDLTYWWGNLARSTLSLYEAILGGADWDSLVWPLNVKISFLLVPIFMLYIAFAMLAMMNVITGIFVESALKNAARDKDKEFLHRTREIFAEDLDDVGIILKSDFEARIDQMEMTAYLKGIGIEPKDAKLMFQLLDGDDEGSLELEALMLGMLRLRAGAKALDIALMMHEYDSQASLWMDSMGEFEQQMEKISEIYNMIYSVAGGSLSLTPPQRPGSITDPEPELADP